MTSGSGDIAFGRAGLVCVATMMLLFALTPAMVKAEGETRSLTFFHTHTKETAAITFRRGGRYDDEALKQLNWFLRDWRTNEPTTMDPRLFDILWDIQRELESQAPIHVISAYRSPETNSVLHRRSSAVSDNSLHMQGKAIDIRIPGTDTARLRETAMKVQYGGVGYYPSPDFVHVDTGGVRAWPRMSEDQLVRLFPDGKTVHLPPSGKPLARYEEARAEIAARNTALASRTLPLGAKVVQASAVAGSGRTLVGAANRQPQQPPSPPGAEITTASIGSGLPAQGGTRRLPAQDEPDYLRALFTPPPRSTWADPSPLVHVALNAPSPSAEGLAEGGGGSLRASFTIGQPVQPSYARFTGAAVQPLGPRR